MYSSAPPLRQPRVGPITQPVGTLSPTSAAPRNASKRARQRAIWDVEAQCLTLRIIGRKRLATFA